MLKFKPKARPEDRRRSERHAVRGMAKILGGRSALPRDCWISNVSDGGARLHSEAEMADEFALMLPGGTRRACRVVWRLGHEAGVEFAGRFARGFAREVAGRR